MIQLVYKRLLYVTFLWIFGCFLIYRFATNPSNKSYDNVISDLKLLDNQKDLQFDNPLDYQYDSYHSSTTPKTSTINPLLDKFSSRNPINSSKPQQQPQQLQKSEQLKVFIDNSPQLSEEQIFQQLNSISNLPLNYWNVIKRKKVAKPSKELLKTTSDNKSCKPQFPNLFDLDFNNIYWQRLETSNASFYLYGAYYDDRWRGGPLPTVRILAMVNRISPPSIYCQFWFENGTAPIISQSSYTYGWYPKWGNYKDDYLQPFIINCPIPRDGGLISDNQPPQSVSLVESKCLAARNNLRVINNRPQVKQDFAVCVKGLDFLNQDLSVRLIEWIELLKILGAKKIFFYSLEIHPNITKVLNYYQDEGIVQLTPLTLPGNQPNLPGFRHLYLKNKLTIKRQNELISYNDCLYRNLYSYSYLALLDIDEVIMPLKHDNWSSLMETIQFESLKVKNESRSSYNFRNVYFLDDLGIEGQGKATGHENGIPTYLHMLQHVYRSRNYTKPGQYVKCFHNVEKIISLHNHFPLNCFGSCTTYSVGPSLAHLQHYRQDCVGPLKNLCKTDFRIHTVRDTTIWKYANQLIVNSNSVLSQLGFLKLPAPPFN